MFSTPKKSNGFKYAFQSQQPCFQRIIQVCGSTEIRGFTTGDKFGLDKDKVDNITKHLDKKNRKGITRVIQSHFIFS